MRESRDMIRVGQNRIYTFIYTIYLVISKPKIPYVHRIYMVLANPRHDACCLLSVMSCMLFTVRHVMHHNPYPISPKLLCWRDAHFTGERTSRTPARNTVSSTPMPWFDARVLCRCAFPCVMLTSCCVCTCLRVQRRITQAVKNHFPHYLRKRSHFGTGYCKGPPTEEKEKDQCGSGGLQAWPETVSWWGLITVLERARLLWTSLAACALICVYNVAACTGVLLTMLLRLLV